MGASSGVSARILGVIWPDASDSHIDYEMPRLERWWKGRGITGIAVRVERSKARPGHRHDDLFQTGHLDSILPPARRLADVGCEAIHWACTSGSFIGGLAWARAQAEAISEATGVPATSTTLSLIEAARQLGWDRLDILGAYPEVVTRELERCLSEAGFIVDAVVSLGAPDGPASFALDLEGEVAKFARRYPARQHPLVIPDTAINSLDLVDALERIAERPVITSNQATVWWGLRMLGFREEIRAAGCLFLNVGEDRGDLAFSA